MVKIKIVIQNDLLELYKKISDLKAVRTILSAYTDGVDSAHLDKDFACYIKISSEDKTHLSYNTISEVAKKLGVDVKQILSGEVELPKDNHFYTTIRRTKIRPGRIFNKIFIPEYLGLAAADIEQFSNRYTAELSNNLTFTLLKGEEMRKWYAKNNYTQRFGNGSLHGSCMGGDRQQEFLDIYTTSENVSLLVAFDIDNRVAGRAIIWSNVSIKDKNKTEFDKQTITYMDRIYYSADWMQDKFKDYARKNGWYHRRKQAYDEEFLMIAPDGTTKEITMKVSVNLKNRYFPYLDTFAVPSYKNGFVSNDKRLSDWNGGAETDSVTYRHTTGITPRMFNFIDNKYLESNKMIWLKNKTSYYTKENAIYSAKSDDHFVKAECIFSKLDNEYITPDEEVETCTVSKLKYKK